MKEIDKKRLSRRIPTARDLKKIRLLGIDEISIQKGHRYLTVVVDLERGAVVWVGRGRTALSLKPFFERLRRLGVKPLAIAMDMWPAYLEAVLSYLGPIPIVYDRFHILSAYGRVLDELRAKEYKSQKLMGKMNRLLANRAALLTQQPVTCHLQEDFLEPDWHCFQNPLKCSLPDDLLRSAARTSQKPCKVNGYSTLIVDRTSTRCLPATWG